MNLSRMREDDPVSLHMKTRQSLLEKIQYRVGRRRSQFVQMDSRAYSDHLDGSLVEEFTGVLLGKHGPTTETSRTTREKSRETTREVVYQIETPRNRLSAFLWAILPNRFRGYLQYDTHDMTVNNTTIVHEETIVHKEQITRVCPHFPPMDVSRNPGPVHFAWLEGEDNEGEAERAKEELREEWHRFIASVRRGDPFTAHRMESVDPFTLQPTYRS